MVITLYSHELILDIRSKSHYEASNVTDVEARYRMEAGTEKKEEVLRCMEEGIARLRHRCWRYLKADYKQEGDDTLDPSDAFVFDLTLSERRAIGKADTLKEAMHTFVVEYALSKFYSDVAQQDLSNKHGLQAVDAGNRIDDLLYKKLPPRL